MMTLMGLVVLAYFAVVMYQMLKSDDISKTLMYSLLVLGSIFAMTLLK